MIAMLACFTSDITAAQSIESLVMPGEVVRGHAELEPECSSCHKVFSRSEQRTLCLDCHEDVAEDIDSETGFHSKSDEARTNECASCHADHEGRNADIVGLNEETFDHALTDFELDGKHLEALCVDCHEPADKHRDASSTCIDCHREDDVHKESLGTACVDCHIATDWKDASFDHEATNFPLVGIHIETPCLDCHEDPTYLGAPADCYACHKDDDAHEGRSGNECGNCHNPVAWDDSSFDHGRDTEFALEGSHSQLSCVDCHSEDPFADEMDRTCVSCHLEDDDHEGHRGRECESCHVAVKWEDPKFDHDRDTDYMLSGAHEVIACNDCHVEAIFETALQSACSSCHLDDDVHEGEQGEQCQDCHNDTSWEEAPYFSHDLTRFPLLGEHGNVECETCHLSQVFTEADIECVSCHKEDDPHRGNFEENCGSCHNPVAWDLWLFDHATQTDFVLDGAHVDVACDDCHRSPLTAMQNTGDNCGSCHRSDDVHDGEFGSDCGRCHSDSSFKEVRSLQ